jgi:hypothetical protein
VERREAILKAILMVILNGVKDLNPLKKQDSALRSECPVMAA